MIENTKQIDNCTNKIICNFELSIKAQKYRGILWKLINCFWNGTEIVTVTVHAHGCYFDYDTHTHNQGQQSTHNDHFPLFTFSGAFTRTTFEFGYICWTFTSVQIQKCKSVQSSWYKSIWQNLTKAKECFLYLTPLVSLLHHQNRRAVMVATCNSQPAPAFTSST